MQRPILRGQGNLQFVHEWTIQPDRLQKMIDSKTRVLLLIEPNGGPLNYKDLPKLGFTLETIYSSPALLDGTKYEIELVQKKVAGDTRWGWGEQIWIVLSVASIQAIDRQEHGWARHLLSSFARNILDFILIPHFDIKEERLGR
jgi:hypothetical protein